MKKMKNEGILPVIVQIGNEITNGLLWPDGRVENTEVMASFLEAGIRGVKEVDSNIKILLHLDFGTDNQLYRRWFTSIEPYKLQYDIIGMSYYPFWNGSLSDLVKNMNDISTTFNKDVLVAETSIGYTTDTLGCSGIVFCMACILRRSCGVRYQYCKSWRVRIWYLCVLEPPPDSFRSPSRFEFRILV